MSIFSNADLTRLVWKLSHIETVLLIRQLSRYTRDVLPKSLGQLVHMHPHIDIITSTLKESSVLQVVQYSKNRFIKDGRRITFYPSGKTVLVNYYCGIEYGLRIISIPNKVIRWKCRRQELKSTGYITDDGHVEATAKGAIPSFNIIESIRRRQSV